MKITPSTSTIVASVLKRLNIRYKHAHERPCHEETYHRDAMIVKHAIDSASDCHRSFHDLDGAFRTLSAVRGVPPPSRSDASRLRHIFEWHQLDSMTRSTTIYCRNIPWTNGLRAASDSPSSLWLQHGGREEKPGGRRAGDGL